MVSGSWQSAWVEVVPDFSEFRKTANKQMSDILGGAGDEAGKSSAKKAGTAFTDGVPPWGKKILGAFVGLKLGEQLADVLVDSVALGSNLSESRNAIKVAYGSAFKDIAKLGKGSAKRLGLSQLDFNDIATQFSAFAKTIKKDNPSSFIDEISRRGSDFASVFNIEVSDALGLFQSGLAGESEPLRKYGIDLSAAAVNAFAYSHGIAEAGVELTETQKQQARYGALLAQTDSVQGDFKNTSGELANGQRIFQASLEDTKAKLGEALLPALKGVVEYGNTTFIPMLDSLVTKLTTKVGPDLGAFISEQDPEKNQARIDAFMADLGRRLGIGWSQITVYFTNEWNNANTVMGAKLLLGLTQIGDMFEASASLWGGRLNNGATQIRDFFSGLGVDITRWVAGAVTSAFNAGTSIVRSIADGIGSAIGDVNNAMADVMRTIASFLPHSPAKQGPFSGSGWTAVQTAGAALMGQFTAGMGAASAPGMNSAMSALAPGVLAPTRAPRVISTANIASAAPTDDGRRFTQIIQPAPGMSEETIGRIAADSLSYEMRGA